MRTSVPGILTVHSNVTSHHTTIILSCPSYYDSIGELTRGMLVVDGRDDQGAYAPGQNRAQVQAELERHHFPHAGVYESTAVPAQVEIERPPESKHASNSILQQGSEIDKASGAVLQQEPEDASQSSATDLGALGVPCVTQTPGSAALVKLLLERVWGVSSSQTH